MYCGKYTMESVIYYRNLSQWWGAPFLFMTVFSSRVLIFLPLSPPFHCYPPLQILVLLSSLFLLYHSLISTVLLLVSLPPFPSSLLSLSSLHSFSVSLLHKVSSPFVEATKILYHDNWTGTRNNFETFSAKTEDKHSREIFPLIKSIIILHGRRAGERGVERQDGNFQNMKELGRV
jgi:hypothetical protein